MTAEPPIAERFALSGDTSWQLQVDGFNPELEPTIEAVFALVNGYLGTRAAAEEGGPNARPATLIGGVFDTPARPQTPELDAPIPELVVAPDWSRLRISVGGQEQRLDQVEVLDHRRVLDMRQGVLVREWRVRDRSGRITALRSLRFASLDDRHVLAQVLLLCPENYSAPIVLESLVDGHVTNENKTLHLAPVEAGAIDNGALLTMHTLQSSVELAYAAHAELHVAQGAPIAGAQILEPGLIGQRWEWQAERGQVYELRKIVTVFTSRDTPAPGQAASERLAQVVPGGIATLLNRQMQAWGARWEDSDIQISGDPQVQLEIRFVLYHLIGAANPDDSGTSVGARALTGERYRGHVFWDTETFVWPFYLYTHPPTARALLQYRYATLLGARVKARAKGYRGALYPWEATDTGEETTPPFVRAPDGRPQPVLTAQEEHHISADIAYAVCQYRQATGDDQFFLEAGAEMLLEIARFWASRVSPGADGSYHILQVIGPDEYHEHVNDNAYTNVMAQWSLRRGLDTAAELERDHPQRWAELAGRLELDLAELERWRTVADRLVTGYDTQTHMFEQFRGYYALEPIDLSGHDTAVQTVEARLGWQALQRSQAIKQSDVVLLLFLLWDELAPEAHEANFRYYEPRTTHDSSLSPSIHALVAARLGDMALAERYLHHAARIDLDFGRKGYAGATGGVHIAAHGGMWQALAFGFIGMHPQGERLRFRPHLPAHWGTARMTLHWRGRRVRVTAGQDGTFVQVLDGPPLEAAIGDDPWQTIAPGELLSAVARYA